MWARFSRKIEDVHNRLSDTNFVWFPFLFLKLRPEQMMSLGYTLKMTPFFAIYFAAGAALRDLILGRSIEAASFFQAFGWGLVFFMCWFNLVTAHLWNKRARRLNFQLTDKR